MHVITLPSGKVLETIHVDKVSVYAHLALIGSNAGKFYVQVSLKSGAVEQVVEGLSESRAAQVQQKLLSEVKTAYADIDPYEIGRTDGWENGYAEGERTGYERGQRGGHSAGYAEGSRAEQTQARIRLIERQRAYRRELGESPSPGTSRRRFLNHAVTLLDELIDEFPLE